MHEKTRRRSIGGVDKVSDAITDLRPTDISVQGGSIYFAALAHEACMSFDRVRSICHSAGEHSLGGGPSSSTGCPVARRLNTARVGELQFACPAPVGQMQMAPL